MRLARLAFILLVLLTTSAHAAIIHMSGFDVVDDTTPADLLASDWITTLGGGATDADLDTDTTIYHNATNGGTASSLRSLKVNPESGESTYISLPSGMSINSTIATVSLSLHLDSIPNGEREIFAFYEGATRGCNYRVQSDGTIKAYYDTELQATSADAMYVKHCDQGFTWIGCSVNGDCKPPVSATCVSGSKYWAELKFRQISAPPNKVACDLAWYGRDEWAQTYDTTPAHTPGTVTDVRIGAPGTEARALDAYVDDVVVASDDTSVGHGWVGFLYPNANGSLANGWVIDSCGGGATYYQCADDYASAGVIGTGTTDCLRANGNNKTAYLAVTDPSSSELSGLSIAAVEYIVLGRTRAGDSGTGSITSRAQVCPSGVCSPLTSTSTSITYPNATPAVYVAHTDATAPDGLWEVADLTNYEVNVSTVDVSPGPLRISAVGVYYYARKADLLEERNLSDHDEGTDDGQLTVTFVGDSLLTGTASVTCILDAGGTDGVTCNQDSCCSWDAPSLGLFCDHPTGGCTSNAQCQTCTGKRGGSGNLNGGAGAPCTTNTQCPQSAGNPVGALATCNVGEGECNDNAAIPCDDDTDCTGWGASCSTTATCDDACPNGSCPTASARGSWGRSIVGKINVDNVISCGNGGERFYNMVPFRFTSVLDGSDSHCVADVGSLTADPDYVVVLEGANDITEFGPAPTCAESSTAVAQSNITGGYLADAYIGVCRENCTAAQRDIQCDDDSDCAGISADSKCIGATKVNETSLNGSACLTSVFQTTCSTYNFNTAANAWNGCNQNSECPGGTCSINDTSQRHLGFCACDGNEDCPAGFHCVGTKCRRDCTVDGDCTTTTRSGACKDQGGGVKVCAGRCTCPCNARSCQTDQDCSRGTTKTSGPWWTWELRGSCVAGKCTDCGPEPCPTSGHPYAYAHTMDTLSADKYADLADAMKAQLQALPDPTGDGRPVLIMVEHPNYPAGDARCSESAQTYADAGMLRAGSARAAARGHHVVTGIRSLFESYGQTNGWTPVTGLTGYRAPTSVFSDFVHFSVIGGGLVSTQIAKYMSTLGACAVGTGINAVPQRYCLNYVTDTYATTGGPNSDGTCTTSATCAAREYCALRPCSSDSSCPSTATGDACRVE